MVCLILFAYLTETYVQRALVAVIRPCFLMLNAIPEMTPSYSTHFTPFIVDGTV